jgi:hypothetical protein
MVPASAPDAPAHLDGPQAAVWTATAGRVGVPWSEQTAADLEAYAIECCRRDAAEQHLRVHGDVLVLRNDRGDVTGTKEAPELKIARSARTEADRLAERLKLQAVETVCKCGATGHSLTDATRCERGHLLTGNKAATITDTRARGFIEAHAAALAETVTTILGQKGYTRESAPLELLAAAEGLAQARLMRDAGYQRTVDNGGPLTGSDRLRGAARVAGEWSDRTLRHVQTIRSFPDSVRRVPTAAELLRGEVAS